MIIGLTGGIGSGKSTVANFFINQKIAVVNADVVAREVVSIGEPALDRIAEHFGHDILLSDGQLNRAKLRTIIFANKEEKQWLEALLHPTINQSILQRIKQAQSPYCILESPLLLEGSQKEWVDRILVVDVPEKIQLTRAMKRDDSDAKTIQAIIDAQISRAKRLNMANDVIDNSRDLPWLEEQFNSLHLKYLQLASEDLL